MLQSALNQLFRSDLKGPFDYQYKNVRNVEKARFQLFDLASALQWLCKIRNLIFLPHKKFEICRVPLCALLLFTKHISDKMIKSKHIAMVDLLIT